MKKGLLPKKVLITAGGIVAAALAGAAIAKRRSKRDTFVSLLKEKGISAREARRYAKTLSNAAQKSVSPVLGNLSAHIKAIKKKVQRVKKALK